MAEANEMDTAGRVVYAVPTPVALRGVGVGAVGLGLCVIATMLLLAWGPSRAVWVAAGLLLGLVAVLALVVLVVGVLRLVGRGNRLVLDDEGFTNVTGPGAAVRRVAWKDVRKVRADRRIVSVDLAGGRQSLIRTASLDVDSKEVARQLRARLNDRRGYRPFGSTTETSQ